MKSIIAIIFFTLLTTSTITMAQKSINHQKNYLLKIKPHKNIKKETVDISNFSAIFIIFSIGVYTFIKSDITIKKTSKIELLERMTSSEYMNKKINQRVLS